MTFSSKNQPLIVLLTFFSIRLQKKLYLPIFCCDSVWKNFLSFFVISFSMFFSVEKINVTLIIEIWKSLPSISPFGVEYVSCTLSWTKFFRLPARLEAWHSYLPECCGNAMTMCNTDPWLKSSTWLIFSRNLL